MPASVPRQRYNMENRVWFVLLTACGLCTSAGVRRDSGSILDIMNQGHVARIMAARRREQPPGGQLARNDLGDGSADAGEQETDLPTGIDFRKLLRAPKNGVIVTHKKYLKKDWCKSEPLEQEIREPGCLPTKVYNKFCYGQCNSFYIPKGPRKHDLENDDRPGPAFKSCSFCRPKKMVWITVTLRCPGLSPPYKRKRFQKVKQCKCTAVDASQLTAG